MFQTTNQKKLDMKRVPMIQTFQSSSNDSDFIHLYTFRNLRGHQSCNALQPKRKLQKEHDLLGLGQVREVMVI